LEDLPVPILEPQPEEEKKKPKTFFILNKDRWEEYDADGNLLRVQRDKVHDHTVPNTERFLEILDPNGSGRMILMDRRLPHDEYRNILLGTKGMPFSNELAGIVIDRIINGESLTNIARDPQMPSYSILSRWRLQNQDFADAITEAYGIRAERHLDYAMDIAMDTYDENNIVGSQKLKIEQLKTQASFDNQRFNNKISNSKIADNANIQINITTGVPTSTYAAQTMTRRMTETGQVIQLQKEIITSDTDIKDEGE
jgi:hypothetical protein